MHLKRATFAEMKAAMSYIWDSNEPPHYHYTKRKGELAAIRTAYAGGRAAVDMFLIRKPGESPDQWQSRRDHANNVRLVRTIVDTRADMVYGVPPERCFYLAGSDPEDEAGREHLDALNNELDDTVNAIYEASYAPRLFRQRVIPARLRDEESNVKLIVNEDDVEPIRLAFLPSECVLWVPDPKDADAVLGCVEIRKSGATFTQTAHTWDLSADIDDKWQVISGTEEDNWMPGYLPIVRFGGCDPNGFGSWTSDAVLDQAHLINVRSQLDLGFRAGAFKILAVSGRIKGPMYKGDDGKERLLVSPEAVVEMEEGGTAAFLDPSFPLTDASLVEMNWTKAALEAYGISSFTIDPSGAPEQPTALLIKMFRPMQLRSEDIADATQGEEALAELVIRAACGLGILSYAPDEIEVDVEFPTTILPMDSQAERTQDASDVSATPPRMTLEDYVKKYHVPGGSDRDVEEYMVDLQAQSATLTQNRATVIGALNPAPRTGILDRLGTTAAGGPNITYAGNGSIVGAQPVASSAASGGGGTAGGGGGSGGRIPIDGGS